MKNSAKVIAQLAKCLLYKHEDLSSIPSTCVKKLVTCALGETGRSLELPSHLV